MCTASNPLVVMFTASGEGKCLCARLVASFTNMEVRCKSFSASTFALLFSNEKWKVENGKILSPLLVERIEHSMRSIVSVLGEGSSRRDILKKPTLQSWHCQYKLGSGV